MKEKILIAGGSSGIGFHLAKRLASEGEAVIIAGKDSGKLSKAQNELGGKIEIYQLDASKESEVMEFSRHLGKIRHLIATIRGPAVNTTFNKSDTEEVKKSFEGKFWAQYLLARHCLSNITPDGSIILTSGIAAQRSYHKNYWQASINGAIEALVKSLSSEILPIRINAVSPGFVERQKDDAERYTMVKSIEPKLPMNRLATQDEIVEAYLFLMKSSYSTGTVLTIDGGTLSV